MYDITLSPECYV